MNYRKEQDSLGEMMIPAEAYYGIQTLRAKQNFPITGVPISRFPTLVRALAAIKEAAARANADLCELDPGVAEAIIAAAREIRDGKHLRQFIVDVIQGGAGTSCNMNANEVIANRALEILGHQRGEYRYCHPNNHVNLSQSTNDVYPTALKIAAIWKIHSLLTAMGQLQDAFAIKSDEFRDILKIGRTQLQDAVPMTLGQEFAAWSITVSEDMERLREAARLLHEMNLGATAIGTGINTRTGYADQIRARLIEITGLSLRTAPNLVEATSDAGAFVQLSGVLKRVAVKLSKICNDLRLLSSGPRAGFNEINLPAMQPGSSIMPGKVNPVIPEMVNQVCFQVIGNDVTITMAAEGGQLELNAFEPIIGLNIFESLQILTNACTVLTSRCVAGITANADHCRELLDRSIGIVTALVPHLGYEAAADIAKKALATDRSVIELALESGLINEAQLTKILDPRTMTQPLAVPVSGKNH
ncbi:MAG: aspartate ammonia-lyase [Acidobacteria bacterium]|nr:aspartate ammonia-lyase [Acidobacteriota bacterium]